MVRNKLVKRYNKYYAHWKDFNILIAVLAMIGLIIELRSWSITFADRLQPDYFTSAISQDRPNFSETFVFFTTALAILCVFFKHYSA